MKTANEVRKYALDNFINLARRRADKTVTFTATAIHKGMKLKDRYPLVCSSIDAEVLLDYASVVLEKREGPRQSNTVRWTFLIL